jgi:23S rRNA pseudouridine1911/1915/1917 synthase
VTKGNARPESALTVRPDQTNLTLAALVREILPGTSWSKARDLCAQGRVLVDGAPATDPARRMSAGERVEVAASGPSPRKEPGLILHLDADVAVVRKPAGVLTVPFERQDRDTLLALARVAIRRMEAAKGKEGKATLRAVQRLDKETSGLVVFARTLAAQRDLQEQLGEHSVTRRYLAIVHSVVEDAVHESLLVPDRGDGIRGSWGVFRPARGNPPVEAREAVTRVKLKEKLAGGRASLVSCELETGRQHQIRIHLAEAGHPLVGETVYIRDWRGPLLPAPRPMLHAAVLGFVHPRTGERMRFEEPPPADFQEVLTRLRSARGR